MNHGIRRGVIHINTKRKKRITIFLIILLILNVIFIWSNSMISGEKSLSRSDVIKDIVKDIISENKENEEITDDNTPQNKFLNVGFSTLIRKAAHFFEFMLFGIILFTLKILNGKPQLFTVAFICLITAVIDEYLQSFSDRTDSVKDVLIDFAGSITGILLIFIIYIIIKNIRRVKK